MLCCLYSCIEGPTGPQGEQGQQGTIGEQGEPGEPAAIKSWTITGTLEETDNIQWDIFYPDSIELNVTDNIFVSCKIRNGSDGSKFMWRDITFYYNTERVRIMKTEITHSGDEYMINIIG